MLRRLSLPGKAGVARGYLRSLYNITDNQASRCWYNLVPILLFTPQQPCRSLVEEINDAVQVEKGASRATEAGVLVSCASGGTSVSSDECPKRGLELDRALSQSFAPLRGNEPHALKYKFKGGLFIYSIDYTLNCTYNIYSPQIHYCTAVQ